MTNRTTIDREHLKRIGVIISLQGRQYLTHDGLVRLAHDLGIESIKTEIISWDPETRAAVVIATAHGARGTYSGIGDASPENVGRAIASACLRMAETRAISRALRLFTGLGMTCTSELPGNAPQPATEAPQRDADPEPGPTPLSMLRVAVKRDLGARTMAELDMLARYLRRVNDTNDPHWLGWAELENDPDGPEWAMNKIQRLITQQGLKPSEILQEAIDQHTPKEPTP